MLTFPINSVGTDSTCAEMDLLSTFSKSLPKSQFFSLVSQKLTALSSRFFTEPVFLNAFPEDFHFQYKGFYIFGGLQYLKL